MDEKVSVVNEKARVVDEKARAVDEKASVVYMKAGVFKEIRQVKPMRRIVYSIVRLV